MRSRNATTRRVSSAVHDVVVAVLVEDRHVLLVHRSPTRDAYPDVWDLPGGHIEAGESTTQAITRELHEELGVVVDPSDVETLVQPLVPTPDLRLTVCRIHRWQGEPVNTCPTEHDQIAWFTLADLAHLDVAHPVVTDLLGRVVC
jgi:8-oxo-dGTP diphosphatase